MASQRAQAIIIGAGPGGLTLGIALQQAGFQSMIYERSPAGCLMGSGFTLWPNALRALDLLDLGQAVRALSTPLDGIAMFLRTGVELFQIDRATMQARFGDSGSAVHRSELLNLLLAKFGHTRVRFGTSCIGFEQNTSGVTAFFDDGSEAPGSVLIGADGLRSTIRSRLFGARDLRYSGYTVWRGVANLELRQRVGVTSLGCGSQFGIFPMSKGLVYWFASTNAQEGEGDWPEGRKAEVLARFEQWHDPVREVIESTQEDSILRNDIYDMDSLPRWTKCNTTLLGDAAHPSTPDLGQGACQAIEDAIVLAQSLRSQTNVSLALKIYEARRLRRTKAMAMASRQLGKVGTWNNPAACWFRNQMIRLTPVPLRLRQLDWMLHFKN